MSKQFKVKNDFFECGEESLNSYCRWLKNKNTVSLHLIERYSGVPFESDTTLTEIKKIILDVSGGIERLPYNIFVDGDSNEKF